MERFTLLVADFEKTVDAGQEELKEKDEVIRIKNEELLELKVYFYFFFFLLVSFIFCEIILLLLFN